MKVGRVGLKAGQPMGCPPEGTVLAVKVESSDEDIAEPEDEEERENAEKDGQRQNPMLSTLLKVGQGVSDFYAHFLERFPGQS